MVVSSGTGQSCGTASLFPKEATEANQPISNRRMEQPENSPGNSRPDGAEPASGAEGGASATEHKEEERLDSSVLMVAIYRGKLARVKEIIGGMKTNGVDINTQNKGGQLNSPSRLISG